MTFAALLFVIAWFLGGIESYFTDNLYNKALVARSAQHNGFFLETSFKHWFFDDRPAIRVEDWHRSASLLAYSTIARYLPAEIDSIVRFCHALIFTVWGLAIMALTHVLIRGRSLPCVLPQSTAVRLAGLFFLGAVLLLPFLGRVAMDIYLDDLPAALMALASCTLMLRRDAHWWQGAGAGILAAASFWMKDLYLVWLLCAPLVAWILMDPSGASVRPHSRRLLVVLLFTAAMVITAGGKIVWNMAELGIALPDQARIALNSRLINDLPDAENQFFHHTEGLEAPVSYRATLLANGPLSLLVRHGLATLTALKDSGLIPFLIIIGAGAVLMSGLDDRMRRVWRATFVITTAFGAFFAAGLGEAGQLRYWLLPFSGALALTAALAWRGLCAVRQRHGPSVYRRIVLCLWAVLGLACLPQWLSTLAHHYSMEPPLTDRFMTETAQHARTGETILVQLHRGAYFWSRYPDLAFTGISGGATLATDCRVLQEIARESRARVAAVTYPPVIEKLKKCGFHVLQRTERAVLLSPPGAPETLSYSFE